MPILDAVTTTTPTPGYIPNPGSLAARELGCRCPVVDNNHGHGFDKNDKGETVFWYNSKCPIHGHKVSQGLQS